MSAIPLAHVFGEPVFEAPQDLFIPPDALRVFLERFEGPLDLLLYLIRRQNLNVLDIPMTAVTTQYLNYINTMQAARLELAAEYLLMAATLIEIKSRLLLPRPIHATEDDPTEDPRAELVRRLLEYEQMKLAAQAPDRRPQAERDFTWLSVWVEPNTAHILPDVSAIDLQQAWLALLSRARHHRHHQVQQDELSVREQMSDILRRLQQQPFLEWTAVFPPLAGVAHIVVCFIAILELAKEGLLRIAQEAPFAPIWLQLNASFCQGELEIDGQ